MTDAPRKKLLYTFDDSNSRFGVALTDSTSFNTNYEAFSKRIIVRPYDDSLEGADGFVFVGPQTSKNFPVSAVFTDYQIYFDFLKDLHKRGRKLVAVINPTMKLPLGSREWVDRTIRCERYQRSIRSVAEEIARFFDEALQA
jgi:hypothetical protein